MGISLNIIKDQSLTLSVEEWLKTNEPHKLKMGESLGELRPTAPRSEKTVHENISKEKEREDKIMKRKAIAAEKKLKETKAREALLQKRLVEQQELVANFRAKAERGDYGRFLIESGYGKYIFQSATTLAIRNDHSFERFKKTIASFVFSKKQQVVKKPKQDEGERSRHKNIVEEKRKAIASGKMTFIAECKHHGMTEYLVNGQYAARCKICKKDGEKRYVENRKLTGPKSEKTERSERNTEAMNVALSQKKKMKTFIGECEKHGETIFLIATNKKRRGNESKHSYRCHECKIHNARLFRERRLQEQSN